MMIEINSVEYHDNRKGRALNLGHKSVVRKDHAALLFFYPKLWQFSVHKSEVMAIIRVIYGIF